jgi:hypothetical protein
MMHRIIKRRIIVFLQIALLLMMCFPAVVMADSSPQISVSLSKTTAPVGDSVTVSGTTASGAWVPLKVIDEAGNIVVFDAGKADPSGNYSIGFIVPASASGTLTVVVGEGSGVATKALNIGGSPSSSSSGGTPPSKAVTSTTGSAKVTPSAGGTIGLGDEATIKIPANALTGTNAVEVKVTKVTAPPAVPAGFRLVGNVYEFSVGGKDSYSFDKEVTITLSFDPNALKPGETPAIYYYDQNAKKWVKLGGEATDNAVTVKVDHFTQFAVMAEPASLDQTLTDITGHWAENRIKELVDLGAISGYPDGTFRPDNNITRAEFATILVKAFKLEPQSGKVFADTTSHWAKDTIATAAAYGIVNGYDGNTFGPNDLITREQMAAMIVNALKLTPVTEEISFIDSGSISGWARAAVTTAVNNGLINGYPDNTIRPQGHATRAEAATIMVNALQVRG